MPLTYTFKNTGNTMPYATEGELLDFANKLREAGGARVIQALMPSYPGSAGRCLIANALNFEGEVHPVPHGMGYETTPCQYWYMQFPYNMDKERIQEIAQKMGNLEVTCYESGGGNMILPEEIGNAAHVFDLIDENTWPYRYRR